VIAFIRLDFPALRIPNIPMCTRSDDGVSFKLNFTPPHERGTGKLPRGLLKALKTLKKV
jgi:hypothetical protein